MACGGLWRLRTAPRGAARRRVVQARPYSFESSFARIAREIRILRGLGAMLGRASARWETSRLYCLED